MSPARTKLFSNILMFTSWSEQSTPAALSIKSVNDAPSLAKAYSIRARCVIPRLPPSPITLVSRSLPLIRKLSLALSPASAWLSSDDLTYVPMPPFQIRSTGAFNSAVIKSFGDILSSLMAKRVFISGLMSKDLLLRLNRVPPFEMSFVS